MAGKSSFYSWGNEVERDYLDCEMTELCEVGSSFHYSVYSAPIPGTITRTHEPEVMQEISERISLEHQCSAETTSPSLLWKLSKRSNSLMREVQINNAIRPSF